MWCGGSGRRAKGKGQRRTAAGKGQRAKGNGDSTGQRDSASLIAAMCGNVCCAGRGAGGPPRGQAEEPLRAAKASTQAGAVLVVMRSTPASMRRSSQEQDSAPL